MKKIKRISISSFLINLIIILLFLATSLIYFFPNQLHHTLLVIKEAGIQLSSVILSHDFKTVAQIKKNYVLASHDSTKKVKILIVPGHNPNYGGTEFKNVKERDLAVDLANELKNFLDDDKHYEVYVIRDKVSFTSEFEKYFKENWDKIKEWKEASRKEFSSIVNIESANKLVSRVFHNNVSTDIAIQLYGITKWSNENDMDIVIHIHFNDNPRVKTSLPGVYSGFAIYVPYEQYGNSESTKTIATDIFKRLEKYNPVSNLHGESIGIVYEPELIAIGSNNTSDAASMLIEYSYIYEPQLHDAVIRNLTVRDMAYETYLGLQDFFDPKANSNQSGTLVLPHIWNNNLTEADITSEEIFALQTALMTEGVYPPLGKSKNDCPRTGIIGPCTRAALQTLKDKYQIADEQEILGVKTRKVLNDRYR